MLGEIRNARGERLDYTFHDSAGESAGVVVLGHGVTGNKDRPFLVILAEGLASAGLPSLRFSFAGNGDSEGSFGDATITKEVADLGAVLDALEGRPICYVGHSMGGAVGVIRAGLDARIRWLVSLAGMVHTRAFSDREFGEAIPGHGCMWDEPDCPLSQAFVDDMARIGSVVDGAAKIAVPWLLVHGTEDDVVPIQDSFDIAERADSGPRLVEVDGSDHVFSDEAAPQMVNTVVDWVRQQMTG